MVELVPPVVGAVHVAAAVGWLAALVLGTDHERAERVVPGPARTLADAVRRRSAIVVAVVALSGVALTAIELTEGTGGRTDRDVVQDPSNLWVGLIAAKAALLAGVAGVGAVVGPVAPAGATSGRGGARTGSSAVVRTTDRATAITAGLVAAALVLGVLADAVGVGV